MNKQDTIADIIRKIRAEADFIEESARGLLKAGENLVGIPFTESYLEAALDLAEKKRKEADRLEAAYKRELATAEKSSVVGNAAKLREALEDSQSLLESFSRGEYGAQVREQMRENRAALSAPSRNCDIYTDFNGAIKALADKRNWHDGRWDSERYCILASWLLAPATEQEGGNNANK